jgi:hypothetical protein
VNLQTQRKRGTAEQERAPRPLAGWGGLPGCRASTVPPWCGAGRLAGCSDRPPSGQAVLRSGKADTRRSGALDGQGASGTGQGRMRGQLPAGMGRRRGAAAAGSSPDGDATASVLSRACQEGRTEGGGARRRPVGVAFGRRREGGGARHQEGRTEPKETARCSGSSWRLADSLLGERGALGQVWWAARSTKKILGQIPG